MSELIDKSFLLRRLPCGSNRKWKRGKWYSFTAQYRRQANQRRSGRIAWPSIKGV